MMAITNTVNKIITIDGKPQQQNIQVPSASAIRRVVDLPAAKIGVLTTRTNNTDGSLTMNAGHGFTTGVKIDLYWAGGSRRNVVVGTVATNVVPITGGSGDNLPVATAAITAMIPQNVEMRFDGDDMQVVCVSANAPCTVIFAGADNAEDAAFVTRAVGQTKEWYAGSGDVNPLAGQVETQLFVSHGDSSGATKTITISVGVN
jgi:hypothetical protein